MTKHERAAEIQKELFRLYPEAQTELLYSKPYELLFAVILSAQTTDRQVNKVTQELFRKYCSLDDFADADLSSFEKDINSIGLYRSKAKNILASANMIRKRWGGEIPRSIKELTLLPGVARKTANVVLGQLYGIQEGIAVDTHVKRLSQRFGLTEHSDPVKIEKDLMQLFPQEVWTGISLRLILYGRYYWPAKSKEHDGPLSRYVVQA